MLSALRFIGGGGGGFFARDGGGGGAFFFPSFVSIVDQLAVLDGVLVYEVGLSDLPLKWRSSCSYWSRWLTGRKPLLFAANSAVGSVGTRESLFNPTGE